MRKGTVAAVRTSFLKAIDSDDDVCNCWVSFFHNYKCLPIKNWLPSGVLVFVRVLMDSAVWREQGSGFLTPGAEAQLSPTIILTKRTRFAPACWSRKECKFSDTAFHVIQVSGVSYQLFGKGMNNVFNRHSVAAPHVRKD